MGLLSPAEVGHRIREGRIRLGLNQRALAARLGGHASQGLVSNWERGKALPSRDNLLLIAAVLGVRVEELLVDGAQPAEAAG